MRSMHFIIRTDGGARGNPGPAGIGVVIENDKGDVVEEHSKFLGIKTNNQAEYEAVLLGLRRVLELGGTSAEVVADSELLIKQANGEYKVRHENMKPLFAKLKDLERALGPVTYRHVRRAENESADELANQAMDRGGD